MSMLPKEIEQIRGEMWADSLSTLLRHGKILSTLQNHIDAVEKERDLYRKKLEQLRDTHRLADVRTTAGDTLERGKKIRGES